MKLRSNRIGAAVGACAIMAGAGAHAQTVLIDLGNDASYRGVSVTNPAPNGTHWNSVWSGAFYTDLVDINGVPTTVDFGFSQVAGTDSYNGPAGATDDPSCPCPENSVYDAGALGDLGVDEAVYDYYVTSLFEIQGLDPALTYDLTFFGSHKYNADNTTRYEAYTDGSAAIAIKHVDLVVGVDENHNTSQTAQLTGLVPDASGIIYIGFYGANGGDGYLNCMKIVPAADITFATQPDGAVVDAGGSLAFTASVSTSDPSPTYQWQKDGTDLSDDGRITGATTPSLSVATAGSADIGEYQLVVTTTTGSASSDVAVGAVRASGNQYDVNGDGVVDFFDLADLLNAL